MTSVTNLCDGVIGNLALIQGIHEGQNPGHIEGELLGEEIVSHRVQPLDVGHMQQVLCEPVKVGTYCTALARTTAEECDGLSMSA